MYKTIIFLTLLSLKTFASTDLPDRIQNLKVTYDTDSTYSALVYTNVPKRYKNITNPRSKKVLKQALEQMGETYKNLKIEQISYIFNPHQMYPTTSFSGTSSWESFINNKYTKNDVQNSVVNLISIADDGVAVNILADSVDDDNRLKFFKDAFLNSKLQQLKIYELTNGDVIHGHMVASLSDTKEGAKKELLAVVFGTN